MEDVSNYRPTEVVTSVKQFGKCYWIQISFLREKLIFMLRYENFKDY